ncbi:MAG TPA: FtsX-like permease family protein, partial [Gammaproteobacteria bacterium]|nr:FtsX-like permease family protein [Gammaproteobacteria bacterium]
MFRQIFSITSLNLREIPSRLGASLVVFAGMAGVVAVTVALLAMARGFETTLVGTGRADRVLILRAGSTLEINGAIPRTDAAIVEFLPGIARDVQGPLIAGETYVTMSLPRRGGTDDGMAPFRGVSPRSFDVRPELKIVRGRELEFGRFELIAGTGVAAEFDGLDIGDSVSVKGSAWKVVGHFESGGAQDSELWADVDMLNPVWGRGRTFSTLYAQLDSAETFETLRSALESDRRLMTSIRREADYYAAQSRDTHRMMSAIAVLVTVIMAIGAVFAALNTMYAAVSTRTVEIATLRALGFDRLPIVVSVVAESLALALSGALVGAAVAYAAFNGYTASTMGGTYTQVAFSFDVSLPV